MAYMGGSIPHIHRAKCCMPFSWVLLSPRHSRRCILSAPRPLITELYVSKYTGHRRSPLPKIIDHADLPANVVSGPQIPGDRKSTRLNSSHVAISYAVFCLK